MYLVDKPIILNGELVQWGQKVELTTKQAQRLIRKGAVLEPVGYTPTSEETDEPGPDYNLEMTRPELNAVAARYGVKSPEKLQNKEEVIRAIEAITEAEDGEKEEPPELGAVDPV